MKLNKNKTMPKRCDYCVFNPYSIGHWWHSNGFDEREERYNMFCSTMDWNDVYAGIAYCDNFLPERKYRKNKFKGRNEV